MYKKRFLKSRIGGMSVEDSQRRDHPYTTCCVSVESSETPVVVRPVPRPPVRDPSVSQESFHVSSRDDS